MSKWHNSPNGPKRCRATKKPCPYAKENHFNSKEEAQVEFERECSETYGFIPSVGIMSLGKSTSEQIKKKCYNINKKIKAKITSKEIFPKDKNGEHSPLLILLDGEHSEEYTNAQSLRDIMPNGAGSETSMILNPEGARTFGTYLKKDLSSEFNTHLIEDTSGKRILVVYP